MGTVRLPPDFKKFLRLLNAHQVEYLVIGGYAVGYHGYPRATADMDIWVGTSGENADRIVAALQEFGVDAHELSPAFFRSERQIVRVGSPPVRIELITTVSGVGFAECYRERVVAEMDGVEVSLISLKHLKINKKAVGRHRDLADLENLP